MPTDSKPEISVFEPQQAITFMKSVSADSVIPRSRTTGQKKIISASDYYTDKVSTHTKQYRFPPVHKEEINKQAVKLLADEIIRLSASPSNSSVWILPKKSRFGREIKVRNGH